jgi:hypothetical protein
VIAAALVFVVLKKKKAAPQVTKNTEAEETSDTKED